MRVHVLQHVAFEDLGSIRTSLERRDSEIHYTRFFAGDPAPASADGIDFLIAMGGPMSVNDEVSSPWLKPEKALLRDAIVRRVPVLGVCLGAQLIASALGAKVYPNWTQEIGWFPVRAVAGPGGAFRFPSESLVFHWHGETFELPDRAVRLAESAACQMQAFQLGRHVMGLQFHPEMTFAGARVLTEQCYHELVPAPYIQDQQALLTDDRQRYEASHALMNDVLDYLLKSSEKV
jgi:GMP synthase-like glutamine amidotransferase